MPLRSGLTGPPANYMASGRWPDGMLVQDAPSPVVFARHISELLAHALAGRDIKAVAEEAELSRSAIYDVLAGRTWPDVVTLAKLQVVLGVNLWPTDAGVTSAVR